VFEARETFAPPTLPHRGLVAGGRAFWVEPARCSHCANSFVSDVFKAIENFAPPK